MLRYYFHLHEPGGVILLDEEGCQFESKLAAIQSATHEARSLLAADAVEGKLRLGGRIVVVNADTGEATDVPFGSVIEIEAA